ncbi:MAG TPA: hypothetical protein VII56_12770 [Rhizomicrobium sp.]
MNTKRHPNLSDTLANLIGDVIVDARHKLIDEAWFGRPTRSDTPNHYESLWERYGHPNDLIQDEPPDIDR